MGAAQSAPAQPPADPSHHFYPDGTRVRSLQSLTSVDTVFHNHASVPISIFW